MATRGSGPTNAPDAHPPAPQKGPRGEAPKKTAPLGLPRIKMSHTPQLDAGGLLGDVDGGERLAECAAPPLWRLWRRASGDLRQAALVEQRRLERAALGQPPDRVVAQRRYPSEAGVPAQVPRRASVSMPWLPTSTTRSKPKAPRRFRRFPTVPIQSAKDRQCRIAC